MARDFTKNVANYLGLGTAALSTLVSGAAAVSFHALINPDSTSGVAGGNDDRIFSGIINSSATTGLYFGLESTAAVRVAGRSQTADVFQALNGTTALTLGAWAAVGGVLDFAGDAIRVYVEGAEEASAAVTFGAASYTPGTPTEEDSIGGLGTPPVANDQFDGRIAELAIWTSDIGTAGFLQLSKRVSPLLVSPSTLAFYMPLLGRDTEVDLAGGVVGTITGSIPAADHPSVIYPADPYYAITIAPVADPSRFPIAVPGRPRTVGIVGWPRTAGIEARQRSVGIGGTPRTADVPGRSRSAHV